MHRHLPTSAVPKSYSLEAPFSLGYRAAFLSSKKGFHRVRVDRAPTELGGFAFVLFLVSYQNPIKSAGAIQIAFQKRQSPTLLAALMTIAQWESSLRPCSQEAIFGSY